MNMQQVIQDPTKTALIQAVMAELSPNPALASKAVCILSRVLPVYLNAIPDLETGVSQFVSYLRDGQGMPSWLKNSGALERS